MLPLLLASALVISSGVPVHGIAPKDIAGLSLLQTISLGGDPFSPDDSPPDVLPANSDNIAIRAVNPGYTINGIKNTGELIELVNLTSINLSPPVSDNSSDDIFLDEEIYQEPQTISLDNLALIYTAKSNSADSPGKSTIIYTFPPGSRFIGRSILLRYESAPEASDGDQDLTYSVSLAMAGSLSLVRILSDIDQFNLPLASPLSDFGEIISSVCWLGGEGCLPVFSTTVKSRSYTTILRNDITGEYAHTNNAELLYDSENSGLYLPPVEDLSNATDTSLMGDHSESDPSGTITKYDSQCRGLEFSEIFSYYDTDASEQFIELYNSTDEPLELLGCKIRYKNKLYNLVETTTVLAPSDYFVLQPTFRLTKNPNTENLLELIDADGSTIDNIAYPHGQKKSASYAVLGYNADGSENWQITYAPTPGTANVFQEYKSCPEGKVINEATGNCVKASTIKNTLANDCGPGKYRNPLTGRCKSYDSDDDQTSCKEGYERNPETGRCRKIKGNNGADYPVVPLTNFEEKSTFIALWALGGIALVGLVYVLLQFRREIVYHLKKFLTKLRRK